MPSTTSAEMIDCAVVPPGFRLEVETRNRRYEIECLGGGTIRIAGHPEYCPTPTLGHLAEPGLIERGRHLHFTVGQRPVTTSRVTRVRLHSAKTSSSIH